MATTAAMSASAEAGTVGVKLFSNLKLATGYTLDASLRQVFECLSAFKCVCVCVCVNVNVSVSIIVQP